MPMLLKFTGWQAGALGGVTKSNKHIRLNINTFLDGSFQKQYERSYARRLSIFSTLVKSDNQFSLWVFHQISSNPKSKVILGNKGNLIERSYLTAFNRENVPKQITLEKISDQLAKLEKALNKKGKALILLISTNKPAFYPELVPAWYRLEGSQKLPAGIDLFLNAAKKKGLNPLIARDFLHELEKETDMPLFAATGTHWNQFASCRISSELVSRIGQQLSVAVPELNCSIKGKRKKPTEQDMDLLKIANLLFPQSLIQPAPLVISRVKKTPDAIRPRLLIIGTSFSGELMGILNNNPSLADREFLYYFKRQIIPRNGTNKPISPKHFDILSAIERNDAVILEVNEATVNRIGYGFTDKALKVLNE